MTQYYYTPIPVNAISDSLTAAFKGMEQDGGKFLRAANINSVVVTSVKSNEDALEDLVYTLSLVHPNRCFVIMLDEGSTAVEARFSARCHAVSPKEHVCSEVVRLIAAPNNLSAVGNVLRANLLIGKASELVLLDPSVAKQGLEAFGSICDQAVFSSSQFSDNIAFAEDLSRPGLSAIDLEWVKLGIWRDQVKDVFENPVWRNYLPALKFIEIESRGGGSLKKGIPACSLLLAGWFSGQLGLKLGKAQDGKLSFSGTGFRDVSISLRPDKGAPSKEGELGEISKITMTFAAGAGMDEGSVIIQRASELETTVSLGGHFRILRAFDEESQAGLLKRFFLIGEATINYGRSLKNALKIFNAL